MIWIGLRLICTLVSIVAVSLSAGRLVRRLRAREIESRTNPGFVYTVAGDPRSFWGFFWTQVAFDIVMPTGLLLFIWFG